MKINLRSRSGANALARTMVGRLGALHARGHRADLHRPGLHRLSPLRLARSAAAHVMLLLLAGAALASGPGEKAYQEMREKGLLYPEQRWQEYVQQIGQRLVAASGERGDFYFYVVDDSAVNAMALPDGYIFVNRGLIAFLRSEDELAGVIGHEIGHVVGHHARRSNQLGAFGSIAGFVGAVLTGTGTVADLVNTATATLRSGYGREFELEADGYGARFLGLAGYDPMAMIDVLHVLKDQSMFSRNVLGKPNAYHGVFSTHPRDDKRLHDAVARSVGYEATELRDSERDFMTMVDGLVYGDEAATGLIKDGAYYHGGLRVVIRFPKDWDVGNSAAEVVGRAPQGASYASITVQRLDAPTDGQTPEAFVTKTLKRDDVRNGQSIEINGYPAFVGEIEVLSGTARARRIAVIFKDTSVYLFRGEVGPIGDVAAFDPQWRATIESFRAMTADDIGIADRQRIRVVEARPDARWAELARTASIKQYPEETLRLLNAQYPAGEPYAGDRIKLIQ